MRLAVISDIHGNLVALEAALDDIARRGITNIICLGDCASGMCWPGETTRLLMDRNNPSIRGNHDRWLTDRVAEGLKGQDGFAFQETTADQRAWLYELPESQGYGPKRPYISVIVTPPTRITSSPAPPLITSPSPP
jgi:hypothetical protein